MLARLIGRVYFDNWRMSVPRGRMLQLEQVFQAVRIVVRGNFRRAMFRLAGAAASLMIAAAVVSAQEVRPAEDVYKNIRVLKGVPANQVLESMHFIKAALGVECGQRHVPMHLDSDEKPMKLKARAMYQMMNEINRANFGGRQMVTCYTCHKGHATPEDLPAMPMPVAKAEPDPPAALPSVDQVLTKYVTALGGEQAMRKVSSRVITASQDIPTGPGGTIPVPAKLVRSMKAPNLVLDVYTTDKFAV